MRTSIKTGHLLKGSILIVVMFSFNLSYAQNNNPLQPFDKFVGGKWVLGNSVQVYEWGPGKTSVIGKSHAVMDSSEVLVSKGIWFWHPGDKMIKGYFTAINMPFKVLDYTTTFEEGMMINRLLAFDEHGNKSRYREVLSVVSDSTLSWQLLRQAEDGGYIKMMEDTFKRK